VTAARAHSWLLAIATRRSCQWASHRRSCLWEFGVAWALTSTKLSSCCAKQINIQNCSCRSQFNCLEFMAPSVTPEDGISGYEHDHTQGPACSIACRPGTVVRNYFAPVKQQDGSTTCGQRAQARVNNADDLLQALGAKAPRVQVKNGYMMAEDDGLAAVNKSLAGGEQQRYLEKLKVGVQTDTQARTCLAPCCHVGCLVCLLCAASSESCDL
jgi:hypothetical protein